MVFDVGVALMRRKVDLRYDPFDLSVIDVWHGGKFQRKAEKLCMEEFTPKQAKRESDNAEMTAQKPTHSRLLRVYEEKNKNREKQRNGALEFRQEVQA